MATRSERRIGGGRCSNKTEKNRANDESVRNDGRVLNRTGQIADTLDVVKSKKHGTRDDDDDDGFLKTATAK